MIKVVCALISSEQRLLITQRAAHKANPLLWEFPGGKVEPGETEQEAIRREIREELAIDILPLDRVASVIQQDANKSIELIAWKCDWLTGEIQLKEHIGSRWIKLDETDGQILCEADMKLISQLKPSLLF